ncbi:MAG TPA: hypothetical protein VK148_26290 [Xanthobacteraceae bacterium]|nr:hypothetical protein [Xanthobacteraceae bacterium]
MKRFRFHDRIGLPVFAAMFAASLSASVYGADAPDLRGVYWTTEYRAKIQLVGGGELPLTPKGKAAYEKNMTGLKNGSIMDEARMVCTPDGPVRNLATPYPFEILQAAPGQVIITHELNHQIRAIALDTPVPNHEELMILPYYSGYSFGRYEGDTLVVETLGFKEQTFLDATGAPHTDELKTTERIRKISPNQLEIVVTVHDPEYYTRDWQTRFVYTLRNDIEVEDYICGEPHRDISSVPGVRRP